MKKARLTIYSLISCLLLGGCSPDVGYTAIEDLVFGDEVLRIVL